MSFEFKVLSHKSNNKYQQNFNINKTLIFLIGLFYLAYAKFNAPNW